jgi:hypothetical protein
MKKLKLITGSTMETLPLQPANNGYIFVEYFVTEKTPIISKK